MYHRTKIRKIGNCTSTGMGERRTVKILRSLLYIALVALVSYRFHGNRIFVSSSKFAGSLPRPMMFTISLSPIYLRRLSDISNNDT